MDLRTVGMCDRLPKAGTCGVRDPQPGRPRHGPGGSTRRSGTGALPWRTSPPSSAAPLGGDRGADQTRPAANWCSTGSLFTTRCVLTRPGS